MENPVPFIETDGNGKLSVNKMGLEYLLDSVGKDPVAVVAIAVQSKTKGIWLWAKPHPKNTKCQLILLDTEGLHDVEKGDEQHDAQLFTLVILLCNCLVYNAVGALDDKLLKELHLVTELTEHIQTKTRPNGEEEDGTHFGKYFPQLFIVLRDFFLELELDNKQCSADEYMENALKLKPGRGTKVTEYNGPRECIREYFPKRKCFALCKPTEDDKKLRAIDSLDTSELKPEFLAAATECIQTILTAAKPKSVEGDVINAQGFIKMAELYVEAMNNGAIPCIMSTVQLLKETECQNSLEEAVMIYDKEIHLLVPNLPVAVEVLADAHRQTYDLAIAAYQKRALFDENGTYMTKLAENLEENYQNLVDANSRTSKAKCENALKQCFQAVDGNIKKGLYFEKGGYGEYCEDRDNALESYKAIPNKGPEAENVLNIFMENRKKDEHAIINADKALEEKDKEMAKIEEAKKREEERARVAEDEQQRLVQNCVRQTEDHQKMIIEMHKAFEKKQTEEREERQREMDEKQLEFQRLREEGMAKQAEQHQELIKMMAEDKEKAEQKEQEQREEILQARKQHDDLLNELRDQRNLSKEQLEVMKQQMQKLQPQKQPGCLVM